MQAANALVMIAPQSGLRGRESLFPELVPLPDVNN